MSITPKKSTLQKVVSPSSSSTLDIIKSDRSSGLRQIQIPFLTKPLNTPQVYRAAMYWIVGSAVLLTGSIANAVMSQRSALYTVGFETTPSIYHAQRIRDSVADMDANAANLLLVPPGQNPDAEKAYKGRKEKLAMLLTRAAQNITIPVEQSLIIDLSFNINNYIEKIQEAQVFHAQGKTEEAVKVYREAQKLVDGTLMTKADKLDRVNFEALRKSYNDSNKVAIVNQLLICLFGTLLIGSLVGVQILLKKWTNRQFNVGLLTATIVSTLFILTTLNSLISASTLLKEAKEDAFDSLHALRQARSVAYSLNADESRYLLDKQFADLHQANFFSKVKSLAQFKIQNILPEKQPTEYSKQLRQLITSSTIPGDKLNGAFATQLNNITFRGEKEATQTMIQDFLTYFDIDQEIRTSQREKAIRLCIGKSNQAFEIFLASHSKVMDINIDAFDRAIYTGLSSLDVNGIDKKILAVDQAPNGQNKGLDFFWIKALVITGAIAASTIYGLRSRIAEYEL